MNSNIDHETRIASLKTLSLFHEYPHDFLLELSQITRLRALGKNEVVFKQDEYATHFTFLNKGMVKMVRTLKPGQEMILKIVTEGECFGSFAIFIDQPYLATAVCEGEVTLIELPKDEFLQFLDRHPILYKSFLVLSCKRNYQMVRKVPEMALTRIETRIAKILLNLTKKIGYQEAGLYHLDLPLTRKEVAAMAGTTTETVVRVLGRLEKGGVIEMSKHHIVLNKLDYLESLVDDYDHIDNTELTV